MTTTINPQVLRIRDFRTFTEEQVVVFPSSGSNLGLITGVNETEPDLGANGTGKSTLWDALSWVLFGKTVRGVRGPSLLPWDREDVAPRVQFTFTNNGDRYTISRTMKPNTLRLFRGVEGHSASTGGMTGETISQDTVEELVGLTYSLFVATVVRGQFAHSFLELSARDKLDFLSEALELGVWETAAELAAAERKSIQEEADKQIQHLARGEGAVDQAKAALSNMQKAAESWDKERERKRAAVSRTLEDAEYLLKEAKQACADSEREHEEATKELAQVNRSIASLRDLASESDKKISACRARLAMFQNVLDEAHENALKSDEIGSSCLHCGNDITADRREEMRGRAYAAAHSATSTYNEEMDTLESLTSFAEDLRQSLDSQGEEQKRRQSMASEWSKELEEDRLHAASMLKDVNYAKMSLAELDDRNPHLQSVADAQRDLKRLEDKFSKVESENTQTLRSLKLAEFWSKGFTDVRLWMLRSALDELEALCNSHTLALGLRGWKVLFDVERETKSGTIAKGFTALISSPQTSEPVPFESWSGGELQRLKVAVQAAMIDLIRSRTGGGWRFEVWDEPTQHLSGRGIDDLMSFYRDRANTQQLEIWVVDHRSLSGGEFMSQLTVTKQNKGSSVKRSSR